MSLRIRKSKKTFLFRNLIELNFKRTKRKKEVIKKKLFLELRGQSWAISDKKAENAENVYH